MEEEGEKKSSLKIILSLIFIIITIILLIIYWFIPFNTVEFQPKINHSNFSLNQSNALNMQFYPNMRFPTTDITYDIENECNLKKKQDMKDAFVIMENETILKFNQDKLTPQIFVACDEREYIDEGMFIAGEGGPTNITKTENFNVIFNGQILLIKESSCPKPNIAIHELIHVLGFDHSNNPNNLMYNFSKCDQTIGDEIPELIDKLYSTPSLPDLSIENATAIMRGKYLDTNITIKNHGLAESQETELIIYGDGDEIKKIEVGPVNIGYGLTISLQNIWISKISVEKLEFAIEYPYEELKKENNKIILQIKD